MRKQPPQSKVDKSGSPRVTLRLHQLKNRGGGEDKKDRNGSGKSNATDGTDSFENSGSVESGGKATSTVNMEESPLKESTGNNGGAGNNEENQGGFEASSHDLSVQSDVNTSQPSSGGDVSEQQSSLVTSNISTNSPPTCVGSSSENNSNNNNGQNSNNSNTGNNNNNLISSNNSQNCGNSNNSNNNNNNNSNVNSVISNSASGVSNVNNNNVSNSGNASGNSGNLMSSANTCAAANNSNNSNNGSSNNSNNGSNKRHISTEEDEETKKKRRKEESQSASRGKSGSMTGGSPKSIGGVESEGEEGVKSVESPGPKVPPLKIVIPSLESEQGTRNGKSTTRHHQALPYIVARSEPSETVPTSSSLSSIPPSTSPPTTAAANNSDQDNGTSLSADEQRSHQRVLRSSHRSGGGSSGAPSGSSSPVNPDNPSPQQASPPPSEPIPSEPPPEEKQPVDPPDPPPATVDLHPRKRKLKPRDTNPTSESSETTSSSTVHTDQPMTNCYQLFLNIRKQIDRRRKGLFPVQPKPPQGFKDYLMNRCTYVLAGNASSRMPIPQAAPPASLQGGMKDLFIEQEKERYRLRMQHVIEKEKLVLSVEQEILRVHGRAARALANQALPFSACTILRDEEVYSAITPEQEEKDRNARSRYNGRLFLSWLQDVDDKWEKIKEAMLLRHHNEAESLHAVQKMDWEWKLKELGLCEFKARPAIEDSHVPMVHVSDDFDLLPA